MPKLTLSRFDNPQQSAEEYVKNLPWYAWIEKLRARRFLNENAVFQAIETSNTHLNNTELLTLESYADELRKQKRLLLEELQKILAAIPSSKIQLTINPSNKKDTKFSIVRNNEPHTFADHDEVDLSKTLSELQTTKRAYQVLIQIDRINKILQKTHEPETLKAISERGIIIPNKKSNGKTASDWQNAASKRDVIALLGVQDGTIDVVSKKKAYLFAEDSWTFEDSVILFRVVAFALLNDDVGKEIDLNFALNENDNPQKEKLKEYIRNLHIIFERNVEEPNAPRKIILRVNGHLTDITNNVVLAKSAKDASFYFTNNIAHRLVQSATARQEVIDRQHAIESPGYGRDESSQAFPLENGDKLKNYVAKRLGIEISKLPITINFNNLGEATLNQLKSWLENNEPGFWAKTFNTASVTSYDLHLSIFVELTEIHKYRKTLETEALNTEVDFKHYLAGETAKYEIKLPYNRFTCIQNEQLLGLAYESQQQEERYLTSLDEIKQFKPSNFITRWWRSDAVAFCDEREKAIKTARRELDGYRFAIAEEMLVRINKYIFRKKLPYPSSLLDEYIAFIELYGSSKTKEQLAMRLNARANIITLLARPLNDANYQSLSNYLNLAISQEKNQQQKDALEALRKIVLGGAFNVSLMLTKDVQDRIKEYLCDPQRVQLIASETQVNKQLGHASNQFEVFLREGQHRNGRGGYNLNTLFSYFAKDYSAANLHRMFTSAENNETPGMTDEEKKKIATYVEMIETFSADANHADSIIYKYRHIAENNLQVFHELLQGKKSTGELTIRDIQKYYLPIAVIPSKKGETTSYFQRLQNYKDQFLGKAPFSSVINTEVALATYQGSLFNEGAYRGESFDLSNILEVIGNPNERARFIERRLFVLLSNATPVIDIKEKAFINKFRNEVQGSVDNALKYLYYTKGWNENTQKLIDDLGSESLRQEIRLDRISHLLNSASRIGNLDSVSTAEQEYLNYLIAKMNITADNFVTGENLAKFKNVINDHLTNSKPNAFLEKVIFNLTASSEFRDRVVINELEARLESDTEASLSHFQSKWTNRHHSADPIYTKHLPVAISDDNKEAELHVGIPVVTRDAQQKFDQLLLNRIKRGDEYQLYNSNLAIAAVFASRSIQREQTLQLIAAHLSDPNASQWRYLPLMTDDGFNLHTQEQKVRYALLKAAVKCADTDVIHINSMPREVGFGVNTFAGFTVTSKHLQESIMYQGLQHGVGSQYSAELKETHPAVIYDRMLETYGLRDIEKLKRLVGSVRFDTLAKFLDAALTRLENLITGIPSGDTVAHAAQILWIAENIITEAFIAELRLSNVNLLPAFSNLLTRANDLQIKFSMRDKREIEKDYVIELLNHNSIDKLFETAIKPLITNTIRANAESSDAIAKTQLAQNLAYLKEIIDRIIASAKNYKNTNECDVLFNKLISYLTRAPELFIDKKNAMPAVLETSDVIDRIWVHALKEVEHLQNCAPNKVMERFEYNNFNKAYYQSIAADMRVVREGLTPESPSYKTFIDFDQHVFKPYAEKNILLRKAEKAGHDFKEHMKTLTYYKHAVYKEKIDELNDGFDKIIRHFNEISCDVDAIAAFIKEFNASPEQRHIQIKVSADAFDVENYLEGIKVQCMSKVRLAIKPEEAQRLQCPSSPAAGMSASFNHDA